MTDLIERLIDAYNAKNLDAFARCFDGDVEVHQLGDDEPVIRGVSHLRAIYAQAFAANARLHATILSRMELGDVVVNKERVTGDDGDVPYDAIVIYRIAEGRVTRLWYADDPRQDLARRNARE